MAKQKEHIPETKSPFDKFIKKRATPVVEEDSTPKRKRFIRKEEAGSESNSQIETKKEFPKRPPFSQEKQSTSPRFFEQRANEILHKKYQNERPASFVEKRNADSTKSAMEHTIKKRIADLNIDGANAAAKPVSKFDEPIRLNKYLAHAGVASRRKADELISEGEVKVNGEVVKEMGYKVLPNDVVTFNNKKISPETKVYILINKPKDCITTTSDDRDRKTVMELIKGAYAKINSVKRVRLFPVGRLDRNTTGVLLITNDGDLSQNLTHPSREIKKIYQVNLNKPLTPDDFAKIIHGVVLEDGIATVDELAYTNQKDKSELGIEIHNGKNRIVRRIFESLGYEVEKLDRVFFSGLTKKDLPRGRWRFLEEDEVRRLKHFTK